jgi:hypothetical protein
MLRSCDTPGVVTGRGARRVARRISERPACQHRHQLPARGFHAPAHVKGTEALITPATSPFTYRSLYRLRTVRSDSSLPETPLNARLSSLKNSSPGWRVLAADPMLNQSVREPGLPVNDGQNELIPGQPLDLNNVPFTVAAAL